MTWLIVSVVWSSKVGAKTHICILTMTFVWSDELTSLLSYCSAFHHLFTFLHFSISSSFVSFCSLPKPHSQASGQGPRLKRNLSAHHHDACFFFFFLAFPTFHFSHTGLDIRTPQVYSGLVEVFGDTLLNPQVVCTTLFNSKFHLFPLCFHPFISALLSPMGKIRLCLFCQSSVVFYGVDLAMIGIKLTAWVVFASLTSLLVVWG